MSKVQMTPSQRRAVIAIIRFYRERNRYTKVTSVRVELSGTTYGKVWVSVKTRRSDCDTYSPRQIICAQRALIAIGKNGGKTVYSAQQGLSERGEEKHVAFMIHGTVAPKRRASKKAAA